MAVLDPRIEQLKSTTFFGKRFTRRQIADIQQTVATFSALSRQELAETICEHLNWHTPTGGNRVKAALGLLAQLEQAGILTLPPKSTQHMRSGPRQPLAPTARTAPQPRIETRLRALQPLRLQRVEPQDTPLWNEFVQRHHYLGYRQPLGPHLRYFLLDRHGRRLGCLLFNQATRSLACRDAWVGWREGEYKKHLDLVVGQPRFLIFPWVCVKNLASHTLSLAARQLPADWQLRYGTRPVLMETFCEIRASRAPAIAPPTGCAWARPRAVPTRGGRARTSTSTPLTPQFRAILLHGPRPQTRRRPPPAQPVAPDMDFVALWQGLIDSLSTLAAAHDRRWQQRSRVLNTLLVMLFVFRLVFAPRRQGYTTTLSQLWAQCRALDVPLPQPQPVSDAAMCKVRPRIDEQLFKQFHAEILRRADTPGPLWRGHRVFAVDGSKLNLPRPLLPPATPRPVRTSTTRRDCSAACSACSPGSRSSSTFSPTATSGSPPAPT